MRIHTTHTRDAALGELRRMNRWIIAASVALTGVLSEVAANAFPGKTSHGSARRHATGARKPKHTSTTTTGVLRPPEQAPQASSQPEAGDSGEQAPPAQESQPAPSEEAQSEAPPPAEEQAPAPEAPASQPSEPVVSGGS